MGRLMVGIDGGGTNTCLMVTDESGRTLGYGVGGSGNQNVVGMDVLRRSVCEAALAAGMSGAPFEDVACVVAGLSGVDGPEGARDAEEILRILFPGAVAKAVTDIAIALRASFNTGRGVVVIAGTGTMAYGHDGQGRYASSSGWGPLAGDEGSAYFIGRCGIAAALKAFDARGPETVLLGSLLALLGASSREGIVKGLYNRVWVPSDVAGFSQHVSKAAEEGDPVASDIIKAAAEELAVAAIAVLKQLEMTDEPAEIALTGGLTSVGELLFEPLRIALAREAPFATLVSPRWPSIMGAVILALEELNIPWKPELIGVPTDGQREAMQ